MPKNKVSEYSSTASNNTDIGGINIAEGCAPSGINNAIRELMAQLKDMQSGTDGDGFTVGGAFTCSGNAVFSGTVVGTSATFTNLVLSTSLAVASGGTGTTTSTGTGSVVLSASPALTGTPTAPTAAPGTNNTQGATTAYVDAAVAAGTPSDARLKKEIVPIQGGLSSVMKLRPVNYLRKPSLSSSDYTIRENGFIAQELMTVLPEVVYEARDTEKIFKVNYISIIPVLTKALQEQQQQIQAQQQQIDELKKMVKELLSKKQ